MEANKLCANISLSLVLSTLISGCTSVKPRTIILDAGYYVGNKKIYVKDVDCEVQVGNTKYNVNIPNRFEVTPKKNDNLYIYCKKSGYAMVKTPRFYEIYQESESLIKTILFYDNFVCNGLGLALGGTVYSAPLALIFQEPSLFFIPFAFGGLSFAFTAMKDVPYSRGYRYRFESIDIKMLPSELLKDTDTLVERNPKEKVQKIGARCGV